MDKNSISLKSLSILIGFGIIIAFVLIWCLLSLDEINMEHEISKLYAQAKSSGEEVSFLPWTPLHIFENIYILISFAFLGVIAIAFFIQRKKSIIMKKISLFFCAILCTIIFYIVSLFVTNYTYSTIRFALEYGDVDEALLLEALDTEAQQVYTGESR